jgi:hypothetical protein
MLMPYIRVFSTMELGVCMRTLARRDSSPERLLPDQHIDKHFPNKFRYVVFFLNLNNRLLQCHQLKITGDKDYIYP